MTLESGIGVDKETRWELIPKTLFESDGSRN